MQKLEQLIEVLQKAQEAQELLEKVWQWTGPYGAWTKTIPMPKELQIQLQRYFQYDNSE